MPRVQKIPEEETKLYHIFADETCQTKHAWMALGTTAVSDENLERVRVELLNLKEKMGLQGEIKWEYTNKKNLERYKTMATAYFKFLHEGILQFHAMIIPMADFDYQAFGDEVPEAAYNRLFHHLLVWMYCADRSHRARKYYVFFDERTSKVPWRPFQIAVCRSAARRFGMDHWPFRKMAYEDSRAEIMLQVNDLILGAIGFWRNKKHTVEPTKGSPKGALARHIKNATGLNSLFDNPRSTSFSMWKMKFARRQRARA